MTNNHIVEKAIKDFKECSNHKHLYDIYIYAVDDLNEYFTDCAGNSFDVLTESYHKARQELLVRT